MKIFIIDPGMVEDYSYELASSLANQQHKVFLFGTNPYHGKKINFTHINYQSRKKIFNSFKTINKIFKGLSYFYMHILVILNMWRHSPDIIHYQWTKIPIIDVLSFIFIRPKIKKVFTVHNTTSSHGEKETFIKKILGLGYRSFLNKMDSFIVHTSYSKITFIENHSQHKKKVSIIEHGLFKYTELNTEYSSEAKNYNSNFKTILFFGNIRPYKGLDIAIRALSMVQNTDIKLHIAGRAKMDLGPLKDLVLELGLENRIIWELGFIEDSRISTLYKSSNLVIMPYRNIDQSGILMGALNFGTPIIASNLGGFSDTISDGIHGYLFQPENFVELGEKIEMFFQSDETIKKMEANINNLSDTWPSWDEIAIKTSNNYLTVLHK